MRLCMPMNEAKRLISDGPFDVIGFGLGEGTASALLHNTADGMLYHVRYLFTALGDAACFLQVAGGLTL